MDIRGTDYLGLTFHPMSVDGAVEVLAQAASVEAPFRYVVTPNVDHMVRLDRQPDLRPVYENAFLVLNDSRVLELLAGRAGVRLDVSPGSDVVAALLSSVIRADEPVTVIGGRAQVIEAVRARYGLTELNWHNPPMGLATNPAAIAECARFIREHPARFVFLCVGSPQQELVAHAARLLDGTVGIGLCCGASLDFLAGEVARAPVWMQRARLEWLHRLMSQPLRLGRRYLVEGPRILGLHWRWMKGRV